MNIKIKKLVENAVIPSYAKPGDAITMAFADKVYPWMSYQAALFMFF